MHIIVSYEGKQVGSVMTNRSLSEAEILYLAGIDVLEMDGGDPKWDMAQFAFEALSAAEYAASVLGRKGGQSTSDAKAAAARRNGQRGGRPRKQDA